MNNAHDWPYAYGGPLLSGRLRTTPEDFQVEEVLGFSPEGAGEHLFVWVEKRGENTDWVARQLARQAGLPMRAVSFAGLKDRHAVTRQWFSLHLPGRPDPDWSDFNSPTIQVLHSIRHRRKLPRGALAANRFNLTVRLDSAWETETGDARLQRITTDGVPNYFGEQRFGRWDDNVEQARRWFSGLTERPDHHHSGLYLSAARAFLFNAILAERVSTGCWGQLLPGDVCTFSRGHSFFAAPEITADLHARNTAGELHPSAPLWGMGDSATTGDALAIEQRVLAHYSDLCQGLVTLKVAMARRPLRLKAEDLSWQALDTHTLCLQFTLPAGAYATTLLRELVNSRDDHVPAA